MMRIWVLAMMASLASSAPASPQALPSSETITIRIRWITNICLGICPDFSVSIATDGGVMQRTFEPGGEQVIKTARYRLSTSELAGFRRRLAGIRPIGDRQFRRACDAYQRPKANGEPISGGTRHGVSHYVIEWRGGASPSRLRACYEDARVRHAIFSALAAAQMNPINGRPLGAGQTAPIDEW